MRFSKIFKNVIKLAILIILLVLLCIAYFRRTKYAEFEGVITDKRIDSQESWRGTRFSKHIIVNLDNGENYDVKVDENTYKTLDLNMRVKRNSDGTLQQVK